MLRRTRVSRLLAAVLALWLAAVTVEPTALHVCAMHPDGAMAGPNAAATASPDHAAHAPATGHGRHTAGDSDGSAPTAGHGCTCLGQCCGTAPVALGDYGPILRFTIVASSPRSVQPTFEHAPAWEDFLLPFATAPPSAATA